MIRGNDCVPLGVECAWPFQLTTPKPSVWERLLAALRRTFA
jgi:hypothetical protein